VLVDVAWLSTASAEMWARHVDGQHCGLWAAPRRRYYGSANDSVASGEMQVAFANRTGELGTVYWKYGETA